MFNGTYRQLFGTRKVDLIVVHCSASRPSQDFGAADIDKWHRAQGWLGCGYHVVIRRDGTIELASNGAKCRPLNKAGAHVGDCGPGWNARSIGVCLIGGLDDKGKPQDNFTNEQLHSLYDVLVKLRAVIPPEYRLDIMGHRDLIKITGAPAKACPCFNVRDWFNHVPDDEGIKETESFRSYPDRHSPLSVEKHKVVKGDTLWGLSKTYGVPVADLMALNNLQSSVIREGSELRIYPER